MTVIGCSLAVYTASILIIANPVKRLCFCFSSLCAPPKSWVSHSVFSLNGWVKRSSELFQRPCWRFGFSNTFKCLEIRAASLTIRICYFLLGIIIVYTLNIFASSANIIRPSHCTLSLKRKLASLKGRPLRYISFISCFLLPLF